MLGTPLKESRGSLYILIIYIFFFFAFFYETRLSAYPVYMRIYRGVAVHLSC